MDRRLTRGGLIVAREVEIVHARSHGWIDLLAFDPEELALIIIEIKTRIDDLGAIERQVGWYERSAIAVAGRLGWKPRTIRTWLLALATAETDDVVRDHRDLLDAAFPARAQAATARLTGLAPMPIGRVLALIDPARHRKDWLIPTRIDGRRSTAPYINPGDARLSRAWTSASPGKNVSRSRPGAR